jgi:hypothetical protein
LGASSTAQVRRAYEETVMEVPFYDAEYGDDYNESVRAELGPQVARAVTDPDRFTPAAKRALLAAIERSAAERQHLQRTCERERESVNAVADTLVPVAGELDELRAGEPGTMSFGTLEARWMRLGILEDRCEAAATKRQDVIGSRRERCGLPAESPDVCAYLYTELEEEYPLLALVASVTAEVNRLRGQYEAAMARY